MIGAWLMVAAVATVLAHTDPGRRGRVAGVVFTGVGAGIALSGIALPAVIGAGGPTAGWLALAGLTAVLTALTWRLWPPGHPRPEARRPRPRAAACACLWRPSR